MTALQGRRCQQLQVVRRGAVAELAFQTAEQRVVEHEGGVHRNQPALRCLLRQLGQQAVAAARVVLAAQLHHSAAPAERLQGGNGQLQLRRGVLHAGLAF